MKYCGVVISNQSNQVDRLYTYEISEKLSGKIKVGHHVKLPFGRGNKLIDAFVIELYNDYKEEFKIKSVGEIVNDIPVLTPENIRLIRIMRKRYLCTYLECIKLFLPSGYLSGAKEKIELLLYTGKSLAGRYMNHNYTDIYKLVEDNQGVFTRSAFSKSFNKSLSSINTMIKHGFLLLCKKKINRITSSEFESVSKKELMASQTDAINRIIESKKNEFLLHGVTGSGKTEVYMNLVDSMLKEGKDSIILVPEIALTPQTVERFKGRFGNNITVYHSKLSQGEKFDEWNRIKTGEVKIAVGARSALFLPFNRLGLIIIDEEHEATYKSDSDPKYLAVEVALIRGNIEDAKVVLGSATPNIETYYKFKRNGWEIITLSNRVDGAKMPEVELVDMREELTNNNKSFLSRRLYEAIEMKLMNKEQIILFLNRRGFSTFISCRECGYVFKCVNCDISLTYHKQSGNLRCHYCGHTESAKRNCPECGSNYVKYFGLGTEKIQDEIVRLFPEARVLRMDHDTTRSKDSHEQIYNKFKCEEADILIGTQMIAKGLDFKNVTLVGIIAADLSLNLPDFRAAERTFQLITQVSGRAGRGRKEGEVILQTYNPDNYSITHSVNNDFQGFMEQELKIREIMSYPPFGKIMTINLYSEKEDILIKGANQLGVQLKYMFKDKYSVLGPCPSAVARIKNQYKWQIMIKGNIEFRDALKIKCSIYELTKKLYNKIKVGMDLNPYNTV